MEWKLLEPIAIGNKLMKNRIAMAPMETRMSTIDGDVTQRMIDYYGERAKGGAGLVIVENTFVDDLASRSSLASSGIYSDHLIAGKNLLAEAIKENGSLAIIQLSHGGRQARGGATKFEPVAPSAVMCSVTKQMPIELTIKELIEIEDAFANAAFRANEAGFDGIEVHGAHGYLIGSFLSPLTNLRNDIYGGSLENRGRFAANIIQKIRNITGDDFIVGYRISISEFIEGGLEPEEACKFTASVQKNIDYINISAGIYESPSYYGIAPTYIKPGQLMPLVRQMKETVKIPVIAVGSFDPELAEKVLQQNHADIISFGRALIADPEMPNKLIMGKEEDIRPCIRGNEGCISRFYTGCVLKCEVNPACGREKEYVISKISNPKKILIVGGGISGLEAARVAARMGHDVTLMESGDELGGHMIESSKQEFKSDEKKYFEWILKQVGKNSVKVLLNTEVTPAIIRRENPDALILAIGSEYAYPDIKGAKEAILAGDILNNATLAGEKVIVVGCGLIGAETALTLAIKNHEVTIIEMTDQIAVKLEETTRQALIGRLKSKKVCMLLNQTVKEIGAEYVKTMDLDGKTSTLNADSVIIATGLLSRKNTGLSNIIENTISIGDCIEARNIYHCVHEAWNAVINLSQK